MIKCDELTDPKSCMSRAKDGEMTFVLLAHDVTAPDTIRDWVSRRIKSGKNVRGDAQLSEALECARTMEHQQHNGIPTGSPAAPTPHMTAAEFWEVWGKKHKAEAQLMMGSDRWFRFGEAYAASETARADLQESVARAKDVIASQIADKLAAAEADLQRKDAALRHAISCMDRSCKQCNDLMAKLAPVPVPEVTPSPCCANPNLVVKGVCDRFSTEVTDRHYKVHVQVQALPLHGEMFWCINWRPTHNMSETIYVLVCSGKYTTIINGTPETGDSVEVVAAFADKYRAYETLRAGVVDVKEPEKWGVRGICVYPVEVTR